MNDFWNILKPQIIGVITRWVLKIGGGFLLSLGITEGSIEEIVASAVMLIVGVIISAVQTKKVAYTNPDEYFKAKQ